MNSHECVCKGMLALLLAVLVTACGRGGDVPRAGAARVEAAPPAAAGSTADSPTDPPAARARGDLPAVLRLVLQVEGGGADASPDAPATELLLTDPQGRRTGFDPATATRTQEIPGASYFDEAIEDPGPEGGGAAWKVLEVNPAVTGWYRLAVWAARSDAYHLSIVAHDRADSSSEAAFDGLPIGARQLHTYRIQFDAASAPELRTIGAWTGTGEATERDELLTYAGFGPGEVATDRVAYPSGTIRAAVLVVYGATIDRKSFHALLDQRDVSARFTPAPATAEVVFLPVHDGEQMLQLSVKGSVASVAATPAPAGAVAPLDTDRWTLNVAR